MAESNQPESRDHEGRELGEISIRIEDEEQLDVSETRIILLGKTGAGKSASGNTILGQEAFESRFGANSVTQVCGQESLEITYDQTRADGVEKQAKKHRVVITDMPWFGDTKLTPEQILTEVSRGIIMNAPGPHVFLLVIPLGRFTEDECRVILQMLKMFGKEVLKYIQILFTRGDDLEGTDIKSFLNDAPDSLKNLLKMCGDRYHVFNNRNPNDRQQVHDLLEKVQKLVEKNEGHCYTDEVYGQAEVIIQEKMGRLRKKAYVDVKGSRLPGQKGLTGYTRNQGSECHNDQDNTGWADHGSDNLPLLPQPERGHGRQERRRAGKGLNCSQSSSQETMRSEAMRSSDVLDKVKKLVVGAVVGAAIGALAGAFFPLLLSIAPLAAGVAGSGIVTAATVGGIAALGGLVGGGIGAMAGLEAQNPRKAAVDAAQEVTDAGVMVVTGAATIIKAAAAKAASIATTEKKQS